MLIGLGGFQDRVNFAVIVGISPGLQALGTEAVIIEVRTGDGLCAATADVVPL